MGLGSQMDRPGKKWPGAIVGKKSVPLQMSSSIKEDAATVVVHETLMNQQ